MQRETCALAEIRLGIYLPLLRPSARSSAANVKVRLYPGAHRGLDTSYTGNPAKGLVHKEITVFVLKDGADDHIDSQRLWQNGHRVAGRYRLGSSPHR